MHGCPPSCQEENLYRTNCRSPKIRKNKPYAPSEVSIRPVREQIRGMKERDAIEHLLYMIEEISGTKEDFLSVMTRMRVSAALAKIYVYLKRRAPHPVTIDQLVIITAKDPANPPPEESVRIQVLYLRRSLPDNEKIVTVWGQGYRMEIG